MISILGLVEWHEGLALPITFGWVPGPREPEFGNGDNIGIITPGPSPGEDLEGIGDWFGFQVKLIGTEIQLGELQDAAMTVDTELRFGQYPIAMWGAWVRAVMRSGGPPAPIQEDEHNRIAFVGNYLVHELI